MFLSMIFYFIYDSLKKYGIFLDKLNFYILVKYQINDLNRSVFSVWCLVFSILGSRHIIIHVNKTQNTKHKTLYNQLSPNHSTDLTSTAFSIKPYFKAKSANRCQPNISSF